MNGPYPEPGALLRLVERMRARRPVAEMVQIGGRIAEAGASAFRISGLGATLALGDCIADEEGRMIGEIVHVGPAGALAAPYGASTRISLGQAVFLAGPQSACPDESWRGRTIDALGSPIDGRGPLRKGRAAAPLVRAPPRALERRNADAPLATGVRAIDAFTPLCYGQRIGVFSGSGVGKSSLLGMLAGAGAFDEVVVGLVGERGREVREFAEIALGARRERAVMVVATGDETAVMRRRAARLSFAIAEWFRDQGRRVLLIVDSLTRYAQAARELGIAAGEPSVARGFPPGVFSDLPKLLERAGCGDSAGGSITGVFSVLVDGDDHNDPVADTIRGVVDGHIVLDRVIADQGRYPAINLLTSLSRLSDRVWTPEQAALVRRLRAMVSRFEESRDLRAMGAYHPGADPDLDSCVALVPKLYDALSQHFNERPSADAFREIADALRTGAEAPS